MSGTARSGRAAQEGDLIVKIQDFADMREFERIISNWAVATGMAASGRTASTYQNGIILRISVINTHGHPKKDAEGVKNVTGKERVFIPATPG